MLVGFHAFLPFLLSILSLHAHGARLFLLEVANEIRIMRVLNCPTRLCHLASWRSLL